MKIALITVDAYQDGSYSVKLLFNKKLCLPWEEKFI